MGFELIEQRLREFYKIDPDSAPALQLEFALKEMAQEIALRGLAMSGFFKKALFHGGTCLRIMHKMQRFSEDLDFALLAPEQGYDVKIHLKAAQEELGAYGLRSEIQDRSRAGVTVAKTFLKMQPIDKILDIESRVGRRKLMRIKVEIDTNPPKGQKTANGTLLWPTAFSVVLQDFPTLFAGKLHALLCRNYEKGRDWYDLLWYVQRNTAINYDFLRNALVQTKFAGECTAVDLEYVKKNLRKKLETVDFQKIKEDVRPLVKNSREIELWTKEIFFDVIDKI